MRSQIWSGGFCGSSEVEGVSGGRLPGLTDTAFVFDNVYRDGLSNRCRPEVLAHALVSTDGVHHTSRWLPKKRLLKRKESNRSYTPSLCQEVSSYAIISIRAYYARARGRTRCSWTEPVVRQLTNPSCCGGEPVLYISGTRVHLGYAGMHNGM